MERATITKPEKRCVTVISGGMDSTVLAYHLQSEGYSQRFISFDYGQKHSRELECAAATAEKLLCQHDIIRIQSLCSTDVQNLNDVDGCFESISNLLRGSALTDNIPVPEGHYAADNMAITVVPGRNAMMLSIAWAVAVADKSNLIACGVHEGDRAQYPDCRPSFIGALGVALSLGSGLDASYAGQDAVMAPFLYKQKREIVALGLALGVPFEDSWSCYQGGEVSCGRCGTCVERLEAFADNNATDPLQYSDNVYWKNAVKEYSGSV